jgi:hypothetical protein
MVRKIVFISILLLFKLFNSSAQNIDVPSLFKPGIRLGGLYMPGKSVNDSVKYGITKYRASAIIPLNGNVNLDLKELNISAHQSFLTINTGVSNTNFSLASTSNNLYNCSVNFLHIRASLSNGLWVYYASAGLENDLKKENTNFFTGIGGVARIYIKGINKINVLGLGIIYSNQLYPIPIIGIRRKVAKNTFFTALLPLEMDLSHKISKKFELDLAADVSSFNSGFFIDKMNTHFPNYRNDNLIMSNNNIQTSLYVIYKAAKKLQIYAEGGVYPFTWLNLAKPNVHGSIAKYNYSLAPYVTLTLRYNIGKFLFGSQLFGSDD